MTRTAGNLCSPCGLEFASQEAFDAHRVGRHAYLHHEGLRMDPARPDGRRCLSEQELRDRGWQPNRYGRWVHPRALRNRPCKGGYPPQEAATGHPRPDEPAGDDELAKSA